MPTPSTPPQNALPGCDACRRGAWGAAWPPPERIAVNGEGPEFLHQCGLCGTYWNFDLRAAGAIPPDRARQLYPAAFADWSPRRLDEAPPQILTGAAFSAPPREAVLVQPGRPTRDWPAENALESALDEVRAGTRPAAALASLLEASTLAVPSTRAPQPDGTDMTPLAFRRGPASALILVFTTPARACRYADSAPYCLVFRGRDFLARLPAAFGLALNDGYAHACRLGPPWPPPHPAP